MPHCQGTSLNPEHRNDSWAGTLEGPGETRRPESARLEASQTLGTTEGLAQPECLFGLLSVSWQLMIDLLIHAYTYIYLSLSISLHLQS